MRADQRARRDAFLRKIGTRPVVMGVLNVTPDSFSDGGRFQSTDAAVAHAGKLIGDGATSSTSARESTRPGAVAVSRGRRARPPRARRGGAGAARHGIVDRYLQGPRRGARDRARRDPGQRRMGPAAGSRDGRHRRGRRSRGRHHAQPRREGSRARHRRRHPALLRSFARARREGRHPGGADHPRSRHRIRQDVAAEHRSRATARRAARLRAADPGRRVAQGISRADGAGKARKASSPERSPPILRPRRRAHHCSACTTSPSTSRR